MLSRLSLKHGAETSGTLGFRAPWLVSVICSILGRMTGSLNSRPSSFFGDRIVLIPEKQKKPCHPCRSREFYEAHLYYYFHVPFQSYFCYKELFKGVLEP